MSPVSLGLDGLLVLLLGCAIAVGVRLNRKLRDLKESQAGFVKAVGELDGAAVRAESGLQALREATVDAHDQLLGRIETARGLAARLDRVLPEAEAAALAAQAAAETATTAAEAARRAAALRPVVASAPPPAAAAPEPPPQPRLMLVDTVAAPPSDDDDARPGERAAALFLAERAARLAAGHDAEPAAPEPPPASRLERFKARRAGARS
jgi:hypothetical protein